MNEREMCEFTELRYEALRNVYRILAGDNKLDQNEILRLGEFFGMVGRVSDEAWKHLTSEGEQQ